MANWRSNPIVGVVAVLLIVAAAYLIYAQVRGPNWEGKMRPLRIYQAQVMAEETAKLEPGGEVVLICMSDPSSQEFIDGFKSKAGNMTLQVYKVTMPEPGKEATAPPMEPGFEGIIAMLDALKKFPNAKCLVNFMGVSYNPMMGQDVGLPKQITAFFQKGGKAVILGGGSMVMPGQKDPFMELVKKGQITMIANRPVVDAKIDKPFSLSPQKFFDTYMMVVTKDNIKAYEDEMRKQMEPPPAEPAPAKSAPAKK